MKILNNKLVYCEKKCLEDKLISDDIRTMNIIQEVANGIDPNIQVTYDVPSLNDDGFVPILDLKVRVNPATWKIEYKFYKKSMASKLVTMKTSAMSMKAKMNILTQQCFKRFHNTCDDIPHGWKVKILEDFMVELFNSGYNE